MEIEQLQDDLINLKTVLEEIEKIDIKESAVTKNVKKIKIKVLKELKLRKIYELEELEKR